MSFARPRLATLAASRTNFDASISQGPSDGLRVDAENLADAGEGETGRVVLDCLGEAAIDKLALRLAQVNTRTLKMLNDGAVADRVLGREVGDRRSAYIRPY